MTILDYESDEIVLTVADSENQTKSFRRSSSMAELARTVRALRLLQKTLSHLLHECSASKEETIYMWDWEMVREAIDPYSASSVFSGVLWSALELLQNQKNIPNIKVIYPEGTKRELLWYLANRTGEYGRRLAAYEDSDYSHTTYFVADHPPSFSKRTDWKEALENIGKLMGMDESVDRLVLLLTDFSRPMPLAPEEVPPDSILIYQKQLDAIRTDPDSRRRNEADAWNLASVDVVARRTDSTVGIITATEAVRRVGHQSSRDPFYFALDMQLRRDYVNRSNREIALDEMLAALHDLLAKIGGLSSLYDVTEDRKGLQRNEVTDLLSKLDGSLKSNAVLFEVWQLVVRSAESLQNALIQSCGTTQGLELSSEDFMGLSRFELRVKQALAAAGVQQPSLKDLGLEWRLNWSREGIHKWTLHGPKESLIESEVDEDSIEIDWVAGVNLVRFLRSLEAIWDSNLMIAPLEARIITFKTNGGAATDHRVDRPINLLSVVENIGLTRIALIRIFGSDLEFWYDCTPQIIRRNLAVKVQEPRVAISFSAGSGVLGLIADFYNKTSRNWLFGGVLEEALSRLTAS